MKIVQWSDSWNWTILNV